MANFLGIDLGSTTSKAVLVNDEGKVVGLGLTNTRSNYDVAAQVARAGALQDAQLSRLEGTLAAHGAKDAAALCAEVRRACLVQAAAARLEVLRKRCFELAVAAPDGGEAEAAKVDKVWAKMSAEADALFGPLADDRSRFFRDVVGGRMMNDAEKAAQTHELSFELAVGAYDRAIVEIENAESGVELSALIELALGRAKMESSQRQAVAKAWDVLMQDPLQVKRMVGTGYGRHVGLMCVRNSLR